MPDSMRDHNRAGRDECAAESRALWEQPASGQTRVQLTDSELHALSRILFALRIYGSRLNLQEPIDQLISEVTESLFHRLGRANVVAERAAQKRAETIARRKRIRQAVIDATADQA